MNAQNLLAQTLVHGRKKTQAASRFWFSLIDA
jgi:hypothetical protein